VIVDNAAHQLVKRPEQYDVIVTTNMNGDILSDLSSALIELPEVVDDPVLREAEAFALIVHPRGGAMEIVGTPFHIRGADVAVRGPAPDAGQHTREVFVEAGIDAARVDDLLSRGVLR
jgi:crotonobetainyl-CoA:carnitine CoA-transferase CaiB-like acyl-CoA transferase